MLIVAPALRFPWLRYTARALQRLGHTTVRFEYTNVWVNRLSSAHWWRRARDRALVSLARRTRPDLILVLRGELIAVEALQAVRRQARGPMVTWWLDDPARYEGSLDRLRVYDHVFLFDRACVRRARAAGLPAVHFLPCACDETVFSPRPLSARQRRWYHADIALVGWYYPDRADIVKALDEFDVKIWGRGWTHPDARRVLNGSWARMVRSPWYVSDERAAVIYNASAIGLNIHHAQTCDAGLNTRTFELLAAGTFELVDAVAGMDDLLIPGQEVAAYRSSQEARELARHYLRHPEERTPIVARGRARVLREHTYVHRMQTLLGIANGGR